DDQGQVLKEADKYLGITTSNVAEYEALLLCLEKIADLDVKELTVYTDSELLVNQITGRYRVRNPRLQQLQQEVLRKLRDHQYQFTIRLIDRTQNLEADRLANKAINLHIE
ncbi:MAG: ribonuclease HI family protein, partial [candidate division KSB1 bacterium]|nr:ribonuclease HI family protein [candidate division KSB1 bacterium]